MKAAVGFLFVGVSGVITDWMALMKLLIGADGLLLTGFKGTSVPDVNRKEHLSDIYSKVGCCLNRSAILMLFESASPSFLSLTTGAISECQIFNSCLH